MTNLEKMLELERLEYMGEIEERRKALGRQIERIRLDQYQPGVQESGLTYSLIAEARQAYLIDLINTRFAIRKQFAGEDSELLSDVELDKVQAQLEMMIQTNVQVEHDDYQRRSFAAGQHVYRQSEAEIQAEAGDLLALIHREISKLKLRRSLGTGVETNSIEKNRLGTC
jgi:hypothetical protein